MKKPTITSRILTPDERRLRDDIISSDDHLNGEIFVHFHLYKLDILKYLKQDIVTILNK